MRLYFGGGLNENQYPNINEAATGSYNFDITKDSTKLIPRSPIDLLGTAPNAGDVRGIMQLVKRDDTITTLIQAAGVVYNWDGTSTFTNVGTCATNSKLRDCYWSLGDYLVIPDISKATVVKKWDGTTFSTLTTGLGTSLFAKYGVVWNSRVWLGNVTTSTDTPHLMVASKFEDPTSYDTTLRAASTTFSATGGTEAFYMLTPDLRPINGMCVFYNELVVSTEGGKLFILTGSSSTDYAFKEFYPKSNSIGPESMVSAGDDVYYMKQGGQVETLRTTQKYGDVVSYDLSRFIPSSIAGLSACQTIYDQQHQKIFFFVAGKVLVLFKTLLYEAALVSDKGDRLNVSPWSVYRTQLSNSLNTQCAKYLRVPGSTNYSVYWGDSTGNVYDINGTGRNGDGGSQAIQMVRKTRILDQRDGFNSMSHVTRGTVEYSRIDQVSLSIQMDWSDEYSSSTATVVLDGATAGTTGAYFASSIYFGGAVYFNQGFQFAQRVSHKNFSNVGKGPGATCTLSALSNLSYQINHVDFP